MSRADMVLVLAALLAAPAVAALEPPYADDRLAEIVAKNIAARGGYDAWKAVRSARLTGTMTVGLGRAASMVMEFKRPNKLRVEFVLEGLSGIQAFDGERGWVQFPFSDRPEPHPMSAQELEQAAASADFDGPLIDHQAKGYRLEWVGATRIAGRDVHHLRLSRAGLVIDAYLDAESHLEIRQSRTVILEGREITAHAALGDYRAVGALVLPHRLEIGPEGLPPRQVLTIDTVELDPDIPDARFELQ